MIFKIPFNTYYFYSMSEFEVFSMNVVTKLIPSTNSSYKFRCDINLGLKNSTQYFKIKAYEDVYTKLEDYTTIPPDIVVIAKSKQSAWIKLFKVFNKNNSWDYLGLDTHISNHEIAELEILYADHNK